MHHTEGRDIVFRLCISFRHRNQFEEARKPLHNIQQPPFLHIFSRHTPHKATKDNRRGEPAGAYKRDGPCGSGFCTNPSLSSGNASACGGRRFATRSYGKAMQRLPVARGICRIHRAQAPGRTPGLLRPYRHTPYAIAL